jgi:hypothetical protein
MRRLVREADILAAICEPIVKKTWEPRRFTTCEPALLYLPFTSHQEKLVAYRRNCRLLLPRLILEYI